MADMRDISPSPPQAGERWTPLYGKPRRSFSQSHAVHIRHQSIGASKLAELVSMTESKSHRRAVQSNKCTYNHRAHSLAVISLTRLAKPRRLHCSGVISFDRARSSWNIASIWLAKSSPITTAFCSSFCEKLR